MVPIIIRKVILLGFVGLIVLIEASIIIASLINPDAFGTPYLFSH